jgi:Flp pilus assembly protein TadB
MLTAVVAAAVAYVQEMLTGVVAAVVAYLIFEMIRDRALRRHIEMIEREMRERERGEKRE